MEDNQAAAGVDVSFPSPGDQAVIYQQGSGPGATPARLSPVTIDRVLKRDVVCNNGDRFNVNTMTAASDSVWVTPVRLLSPSDPRVSAGLAAATANKARSALLISVDRWRQNRAALLADEVVALSEIIATAEQLRALITAKSEEQ